MNEIDGGPAFPQSQPRAESDKGMSLRDWFAGQALVALMGNASWVDGLDKVTAAGEGKFKTAVAAHAYLLADLMLEEREKLR